jgi:hypothetical protein
MSLVAMANVAFQQQARSSSPAGIPAPPAEPGLEPAAKSQPAPPVTARENPAIAALNIIVTYIPTEILTLYVAIVAFLQSSEATKPGLTTWITFWAFLFATPVVVWILFATKVKSAGGSLPLHPRVWPWWAMIAATIAYAAWAFALPDTPFRAFDWYSGTLGGIAVLVVSAGLGLIGGLVGPAAPAES